MPVPMYGNSSPCDGPCGPCGWLGWACADAAACGWPGGGVAKGEKNGVGSFRDDDDAVEDDDEVGDEVGDDDVLTSVEEDELPLKVGDEENALELLEKLCAATPSCSVSNKRTRISL